MNRVFAVAVAAVLCVGFLGDGSTPDTKTDLATEDPPLLYRPSAADEVFNSGVSSPVVSFSIVQGGLAEGTVDGGGNADLSPLLADVLGLDGTYGTVDDVLTPTAASPAVDAGSNLALPPDRFDLDDDGDTTEPIPVDRKGGPRVFDSGSGMVVDIGAFELGSPATDTAMEDELLGTFLSVPYPNPASARLQIRYGVSQRQHVTLTVHDVLGRKVAVVYSGVVDGRRPGVLETRLDYLASGVYFITMDTNGIALTKQFTIAR